LLRGLLLFLAIPLAALWYLVARRRKTSGKRSYRLPAPTTDGLSFHGPVILRASKDGEVTALSARCPHLGCLINQRDGENLVCPCHGSRFTLEGRVQQGPARVDLTPLSVRREPKNDSLVITAAR
jgi:Rieske Fe-S protein